MPTDDAYLGFCLRAKSSISDQWLSHRVKERGYYKWEPDHDRWSGKVLWQMYTGIHHFSLKSK